MTLNGCRLGFYEPLRKTLTSAIYKDASYQSFGVNLFSGAASGILGAAAGSPFFPRQDPSTVLLPLPSRGHTASLQKRL